MSAKVTGEANRVETPSKGGMPKAAVKKTVKKPFALQSPFSDPAWPIISPEHGEIIMELLYRLLEPIGAHRAAWVKPSKGKRDRKSERKRKRDEQAPSAPAPEEAEQPVIPPPPEISQHIAVGFNSVVRCLDPAARKFIDQSDTPNERGRNLKLAAIFVDQSTAPEILWSQLPFLTTAAEMRDASYHARIVPLARGSASRLGKVLGRIPNVGIVGVSETAAGAAPLLSFVQEHISPVEIPWLKDANSPSFRPTTVGVHTGPDFREIKKG